jgi:hypothetical protein
MFITSCAPLLTSLVGSKLDGGVTSVQATAGPGGASLESAAAAVGGDVTCSIAAQGEIDVGSALSCGAVRLDNGISAGI